jgi:hypothetical protein
MEKMSNKPKGKETPPERAAKRRAVISYVNLSPDLLSAFKEKYPRGYADYMGEVFKVEKPDGSFFYAISLEVPDAIYLVKVDVKIDDYEDLERGLFGGGGDDDGSDPDEFPDDDSSSSFTEEEESDD